jgi:hypothetical protein
LRAAFQTASAAEAARAIGGRLRGRRGDGLFNILFFCKKTVTIRRVPECSVPADFYINSKE